MILNNEIWKDIPKYEGLYQVSNYGRVKSLERYADTNHHILEKILKTNIAKGYPSVNLSKNDIIKSFYVHYLVALVFLDKNKYKYEKEENIELININNLEINHKDENKNNNCVDNLEYCTHLYNMRYGTGIKRSGLKQLNNKERSKPVEQYTKNNVFINKYPSIMEAHRITGCIPTLIILCCQGKRKTHSGYKWRYVDEL